MSDRLAIHQRGVDVVLEQLQAADFLICASERQRDFWLGALSVANRINPYTSEADPSLRSLIDVVPFGLPAEPPRPSRSGIKGLVPGIAETDIVVLWWGGIWNWFDPVTAIEAMASLGSDVPGLKLYFTGVDHPNHGIQRWRCRGWRGSARKIAASSTGPCSSTRAGSPMTSE